MDNADKETRDFLHTKIGQFILEYGEAEEELRHFNMQVSSRHLGVQQDDHWIMRSVLDLPTMEGAIKIARNLNKQVDIDEYPRAAIESALKHLLEVDSARNFIVHNACKFLTPLPDLVFYYSNGSGQTKQSNIGAHIYTIEAFDRLLWDLQAIKTRIRTYTDACCNKQNFDKAMDDALCQISGPEYTEALRGNWKFNLKDIEIKDATNRKVSGWLKEHRKQTKSSGKVGGPEAN